MWQGSLSQVMPLQPSTSALSFALQGHHLQLSLSPIIPSIHVHHRPFSLVGASSNVNSGNNPCVAIRNFEPLNVNAFNLTNLVSLWGSGLRTGRRGSGDHNFSIRRRGWRRSYALSRILHCLINLSEKFTYFDQKGLNWGKAMSNHGFAWPL